MIYPITVYGNGVLKKAAEPIPADYPELPQLIENMFATMYQARGCGLAAPQIDKLISLFVVDTTEMLDEESDELPLKKAFINAKIVDFSGENELFCEGCLSVPGINEDVLRKNTITITYQDLAFKTHKETYGGMAARVIQHEYDHILGKTFIDRLSPLKRTLLKGRLKDIITGKKTTFYRTKPNKK